MGQLGVLFSLDAATVERIRHFSSDEERLDYVQESIEEVYFEEQPQWVAELDKSWDALHRSLTNGRLEWDNGSFPLNHAVLGGELLYSADDYIMTLKTPPQVQAVAAALALVTEAQLRVGYDAIIPEGYGTLSEDDFAYTWEWLSSSLDFWQLAAQQGRYVLFTADQ